MVLRGRSVRLGARAALLAGSWALASGLAACSPDAAEHPAEIGEAAGPLVSIEAAKLVADDAIAYGRFGTAVALSGDTAVIGAPSKEGSSEPGAAYVMVKSGGAWTLEQKLVPSNGNAGDMFGASVAISGDTILVGAYKRPNVDIDLGPLVTQYPGAAYVFVKSGGAWTEQQMLIPKWDFDTHDFGYSVALSGDKAIIGTSKIGNTRVHLFTRSGGVWAQSQYWEYVTESGWDHFGWSVAISDEAAFIAAPSWKGQSLYEGRVFACDWSGSSFTCEQQLVASDGGSDDWLGWSVALDETGDTLVIGGRWSNAAYVFAREGGVWTEQQKLLPGDAPLEGQGFGRSVAISPSGDTITVGAILPEFGPPTTGDAYTFVRSGGVWIEQSKLVASAGEGSDQIGWAVATSDTEALVGAPMDNDVNPEAGAVYVFSLGGSGSGGSGGSSNGSSGSGSGSGGSGGNGDSGGNGGGDESGCGFSGRPGRADWALLLGLTAIASACRPRRRR